MSTYCYAGLVVVAIVIITFAAYAFKRKSRKHAQSDPTIGTPAVSPPVNCTRFQEYIDIYEKRVLAFLVEDEANRLDFAYPIRERLRNKYGTELLFPPYEAQRWLFDRGVSLADIERMQSEWLKTNSGNLNTDLDSREVVRILKERNYVKAQVACRNLLP